MGLAPAITSLAGLDPLQWSAHGGNLPMPKVEEMLDRQAGTGLLVDSSGHRLPLPDTLHHDHGDRQLQGQRLAQMQDPPRD